MEYSSLFFIYCFLPVSLLLYYCVPNKLKDMSLLLMSMAFCGLAGLPYLAYVMVFTLVNYTCARQIYIFSSKKDGRYKLIPMAAGMVFNIAGLFILRMDCFAWIRHSVRLPDGFFPVGVSLFTLSATGYLIDVYSGKYKADKNFVRFALYIMMFPRLLMGPVLRYDIFKRILRTRRIGFQEIGKGAAVFIKGLAKKVIAADTLYSMYSSVDSINVSDLSAGTVWMGISAYILCLYFTLSGVADMGVGIGYCFGFSFPQSFNYPLFSSRIRYFASRWHLQVIHWFRKYITRSFSARFKNRYVRKMIYVAAWTLAGFWYGFDAGSALWGALMGTSIVIEKRLSNSKMLKATGIIYTFLLTTVFAVFLSCDSLKDSFRYIFAMLGGNHALADMQTLYLMKSYLVLLIIMMYASTDLFRNILIRSGRSRIKAVINAAAPAVGLLVLIICTALIAYSGSSDMILLRL